MHMAYGGVVPELASRDHIRRVLPLLDAVLADAGRTLARRRRHRGHDRPRPGRGAAGRREHRPRAGLRPGQAGAGRAPPGGPPPFAPAGATGPALPVRGAPGVRGPYATARRPRLGAVRTAGRDAGRRGRRGVRQDGPVARTRLSRRSGRFPGCRIRHAGRDPVAPADAPQQRPRLQLQRPEDGRADRGETRRRFERLRAGACRHRARLRRRDRRRVDREGAARARADRTGYPGGRRRRRREPAIARTPRAGNRGPPGRPSTFRR